MSYGYQLPYNRIKYVKVYCKEFSLHEYGEEPMFLPKLALGTMIMQYEDILLDLENENGPVKKYWSDREIAIYTKKVFEKKTAKTDGVTKKKVLCISKPPVDVVLTAESFQSVVLRTVILNRILEDDCIHTRVSSEFKLNSSKTIIFHKKGTFSIFDENAQQQFEMKLTTLIELLLQRKKMLDDLNSQDSSNSFSYGEDGLYGIYSEVIPFEDSRAFCFSNGEDIILKKHTFDLMLNVALGAPMWKVGMKEDEKIQDTRMLYWNNTPFNVVKKIELTSNKCFTVFNDVYNVFLSLPITALKALLDHKVQILSDLESQAVAPTSKKNFLNEYWTDEDIAIRTGALYNLYREVDCNALKFVKIENNECTFVAHKGAFLKLLETYPNRGRHSKRR